MTAHLFIRTGPNGGEVIALGDAAVTVGRARSCAICLSDPFVSRQHFRVELRGGAYWVVDLGSSNRVAVNGVPVAARELRFGDEIRLGSTRILFVSGATPGAPPSDITRVLTRQLPSVSMQFDMVGANAEMARVFEIIQKVAPLEATVLITGESGTGKELVAKALHRNSPRAKGPLVALNCAAIAHELIESELFGHEKGAFTGAHMQRLGKFELAGGGTLFLDEISELPPEGQAKLLRVLDEKKVTRVGGQAEIPVDARIMAATNRDLEALVQAKCFRQDLLYRLEVVSIQVPPLRERKDDIPLLARYFLERYRLEIGRRVDDFEPEALARLEAYDWPGNVRELKNVVERAVIFSSGSRITAADISLRGAPGLPPASGAAAALPARETRNPEPGTRDPAVPQVTPIDQLIRQEISRALALTGGNKKQAAELLGIPRSSLYSVLEKDEGKKRLLTTEDTEDGQRG